MKTLQNNFTTIEQSKRLIELGVPAWTADCFHPTDLQQNPIEDATPTIITYQLDTHEIVWDKAYGFPCWSVGRLIEICLSVFETYYLAPKAMKITTKSLYGAGLIEDCVRKLEELHESYIIDFSKLYEEL